MSLFALSEDLRTVCPAGRPALAADDSVVSWLAGDDEDADDEDEDDDLDDLDDLDGDDEDDEDEDDWGDEEEEEWQVSGSGTPRQTRPFA
ncbi:MAG: hypothetical protein KGN76_00685 [Acidobacteriota bacterium]|nr:hypothetical protein [Acidobacteriota bacterium]